MNDIFQHFLSRRFLQFCSVGASGVFVNLGILAALDGFGLHRLIASAIAIECSILSNFAANEFWTFRDRAGRSERLSRMVQFQLVSLVGAAIQFLVFMLSFFGASILIQSSSVNIIDSGEGQSIFTALMRFISAPPDLGYVMYVAQLLG
ncbi:MAG: GtrA family protein, partial [Bradymonadia bacterium]